MGLRLLVMVLGGALVGWLIWRLGRGEGGSCVFFCHPLRAAVTGAAFGALLGWNAAPPKMTGSVLGLVPRSGTMTTTTTTITPGVPVHVDEASFESLVTATELPILLDAYADWCGPCRMLAPELEQLAKEYEGRLIVAKFNTDENPSLAGALRVRGIPALFVIKGQRVVDGWTGYADAATMAQRLAAHLD